MPVIVDRNKCIGCGSCARACPHNAIAVKDKKAVPTDACIMCGTCVGKCPMKAISLPVKEQKCDISEYHGVWIFAEQRSGVIPEVVFELLGKGRELANAIGTELCAILCGSNVAEAAKELFGYGADKVYLADDPALKDYTSAPYTKVIYEAISAYKPEVFLLGATHIGRDLAPCLSVKCNTGVTADCTVLEIDPEDKKLLQTRPAFGGNLMATIACAGHRPQMSTVRPGVMTKAPFVKGRSGALIRLPVALEPSDLLARVIETVKKKTDGVSLADADVIVAAGAGVTDEAGFKLIHELADKLGGAVACTRPVVEKGKMDASCQIGQTGITVKPKIYFACGVSGAIQHVSGMKDSDCIIAINKNPMAPIFAFSDFGIVGDLYQVLPEIIKAL